MNTQERGYLTGNYRLFTLSDSVSMDEIDYHYHRFHKLLYFRGGCAGYVIEGRHFPLQENDLLLVPAGTLHKPETGTGIPYSRTILYLSPDFLKECGLEACFAKAQESGSFVLRPGESTAPIIKHLYSHLEQAERERSAFGKELLVCTLIQQILIYVGREMSSVRAVSDICSDRVAEILKYISDHITEDLDAGAIASCFYISKYHLMRLFREETGYSLHKYIVGKRLLYARELISSGTGPTEACFKCGYRDYSAFARAYKKCFGESPRPRLFG